MDEKITKRLLWISSIGSTILVLPYVFLIGFEIYIFFQPCWFSFWHMDRGEFYLLKLFSAVVIWLLFPFIYLWCRRRVRILTSKRLIVYGAFSNGALLIFPILYFVWMYFKGALDDVFK